MSKIRQMILSGACACLIGISGMASAACSQPVCAHPAGACAQQMCYVADACRSSCLPQSACRPNRSCCTARPGSSATAAPTVMPTAAPTQSPSSGGSVSFSMAEQVLAIANNDRANAGLSPFTMDANLTRAAQIRAQEIAESFSHTRPDGSSFSTVTSGAYAENIAKGQRSAERVMAAWMSSDGHRANILNGRYTKIGICAYEHNGVMYWVQLFGR